MWEGEDPIDCGKQVQEKGCMPLEKKHLALTPGLKLF